MERRSHEWAEKALSITVGYRSGASCERQRIRQVLPNRKGRPRARAPSYACTTFISAARRTESGRDGLARFLLALRERPDVLKEGRPGQEWLVEGMAWSCGESCRGLDGRCATPGIVVSNDDRGSPQVVDRCARYSCDR